MNWADIDHRTVLEEDILESIKVQAPIDHRARHRSSLHRGLTSHQKLEPRIIQKGYGRRGTKDVQLPMSGVRCDRNQSEDLALVRPMGFSTSAKPVHDTSAALRVSSVWWVHEDAMKVPGLLQTVMGRQSILNFRSDDRMLVRAWIEIDLSTKHLSDSSDVLRWCSEVLVSANDFSTSCHP